MSQSKLPLIIDLDGTLIKSDLLYESFYALLKRNPFMIFIIPFWLFKGKAYLKYQIAARVDIDVNLLPYNKDFLDYFNETAFLSQFYLIVRYPVLDYPIAEKKEALEASKYAESIIKLVKNKIK